VQMLGFLMKKRGIESPSFGEEVDPDGYGRHDGSSEEEAAETMGFVDRPDAGTMKRYRRRHSIDCGSNCVDHSVERDERDDRDDTSPKNSQTSLNCFGSFGSLGLNFKFGFQLRRALSWTPHTSGQSFAAADPSRSVPSPTTPPPALGPAAVPTPGSVMQPYYAEQHRRRRRRKVLRRKRRRRHTVTVTEEQTSPEPSMLGSTEIMASGGDRVDVSGEPMIAEESWTPSPKRATEMQRKQSLACINADTADDILTNRYRPLASSHPVFDLNVPFW
jgi:hypothetical protein